MGSKKAKPVRTITSLDDLADDQLLTTEEVQQCLSVSRSYVDRLCASGKLQKHHIGTSLVRFYVRDIRKLID